MNSRIPYITFNLLLLIDYMATFACRGISGDFVLKLVIEQLLASHIVWVLLEHILGLYPIEFIIMSFKRKCYSIFINQCYIIRTLIIHLCIAY